MRRAVLLAVVVLAAGCGGGHSTQQTTALLTTAPPVTTTSADPGRDAVDAFVAAARSGSAPALWSLLSVETKQRLGPTLVRFKGRPARRLARVAAFSTFRVIVSERVTPEFGVVAIDGFRLLRGNRARAVYAVALRLEGSRWKVELGGPVTVRPIGPDPSAREQVVAQVAAAVEGPGGAGTAVMYVDGQTENPHVAGTATNATLYANFEPALYPGRHTVVVFAADGREASATAWAFSVER